MLKINPTHLEEGTCSFPESTGNDVIVVLFEGEPRAYRNVCPHQGTPLNIRNDKIIAKAGEYLVCTNHYALFETRSGQCVGGPCTGANLTPVEIEVVEE